MLFPARLPGRYRWQLEENGTRTQYRTADSWRPDKAMAHAERVVHTALETLDIPSKGEGCHTLRRAAARALFDSLTQESGYDSALRIVSAWLHHKNSTTTERYLGLSVERRLRDEFLRGREFLSPSPHAIVVPFPETSYDAG
jgi:integrase